jgi:hypothetical protein
VDRHRGDFPICVGLLTQESEDLRLLVFQIYGNLLAKVTRRVFVFPLRHQVLDLVVMLVLHLKDENTDVGQVRGQALEPVFRLSSHGSFMLAG